MQQRAPASNLTLLCVHPQTLRALFQYKPQNIDELMINTGDFVYVDPTQQSDVSEGWVIGTSHRTGCRGFLPENYTERANESDTWVKHRQVVLLWVLLYVSRFSCWGAVVVFLLAVSCGLPGRSWGQHGQRRRGSWGSGWDAETSGRKDIGHTPTDTQSSLVQLLKGSLLLPFEQPEHPNEF